ncbi:unnamed protein product [Notodromas monacha]|uniref:Uncharacterized protein n=1 Tax=Notodromas monacha TaxID=399045 RepID=A0A7R9BK48_9CRUS|nr:unnamed protein product [Notodromas monacha]CAG0915864.1 unnamed protein product [Notodromas monacha]
MGWMSASGRDTVASEDEVFSRLLVSKKKAKRQSRGKAGSVVEAGVYGSVVSGLWASSGNFWDPVPGPISRRRSGCPRAIERPGVARISPKPGFPMAEDVRAPSAGVTSVEDEATSVSGFHDEDDDDDDDGGASWPEEEALSLDSVGSHSSEDELETINSVQNAAVNNSVADEDEQSLVSHQLRRKRSRPGSSFSSDDDDEVSDILLSAEGGGVDVDEDSSTGPASVAPVQFSATPPQDLPRPGRVLAASTTNSTTSSRATLSTSSSEGMGFHRPSTTSSTPTTQRQATDSSRVVHAARQPRPFLDFDKMRQRGLLVRVILEAAFLIADVSVLVSVVERNLALFGARKM